MRPGTSESLARQPQNQGITMQFRARLVASAALVTAGFLLAPSALAASHPVQVTGNQLKSALLPASSIGSGFKLLVAVGSGKSLLHQRAIDHVSSMSCANFENGSGRLGESAFALSVIDNQNPMANYPNAELSFAQAAYQFPTAKAAGTYYSQAKAKYAKCRAFTESAGASSVPGGGHMEIKLRSLSKTKVGRYQAFQLTQSAALSGEPGFSLMLNTTVTVEGTDVFTVLSFSGTNHPVSGGLMLKLVNRVRKLR
jgi:hypothetical protein